MCRKKGSFKHFFSLFFRFIRESNKFKSIIENFFCCQPETQFMSLLEPRTISVVLRLNISFNHEKIKKNEVEES